MKRNILLSSFQKFVKTESSAGMFLFGAAVIALIWANSPYGGYYESLWQYKIGISFHNLELKKSLFLWINDGLMTIFFFLIGLELKRELLIGEINTLKKAAFPLIAALGGVIIPITLYLILNKNPETVRGWGIPMATDIAFALAILTTLGKRIPISLKVFLTAFAIIDDIAAVLIIAIFYSSNINWSFLFYGIILIGILGIIYSRFKYSIGIGLVFGSIIWLLFLKSGIHPTIAGVLLAFTIPIKRRIDIKSFSEQLSLISDKIVTASNDHKRHLLTKEEIKYIDDLDNLISEVRSPLQHLEYRLHNWVAFFILPIFAFANAGVVISTGYNFNFSLIFNIAISLFIGKFTGITLFSLLGLKLKLTELPTGMKIKHIFGIAAIGGIGFTMSIFINNLAFYENLINVNSAKMGIIIGSLISGITGYTILRITGASNNNSA